MIPLFDLNCSYESDPEIESWWQAKPPGLSAIARHWWDVMRQCGADVRETLHNGYPTACLDVYPFAYVDAFTSHVNVGFYYGAFLPDPQGILIGTGKRMRHVKLFPGEDHDVDALEELIRQSYLDLQQRLETLPPQLETGP